MPLPDHAVAARFYAMHGMAISLGAMAMDFFTRKDSLAISMKGAQDWLTAADGAVEDHFRAMIATSFPIDRVIGEEGGGDEADCLWIIDPIDGTANFAHGERQWCISIGFVLKGVPTLGIIHAPALGETFLARKNHGATLNGAPIHAAATTDMKRATVEAGWSPRLPPENYLTLVEKMLQAGTSPKRGASGALGLAHVAMGRTDAYIEAHINAWDVAAGLVICAEAGARLNDFCSGDWLTHGNAILAAAPGIAETIATLSGIQL